MTNGSVIQPGIMQNMKVCQTVSGYCTCTCTLARFVFCGRTDAPADCAGHPDRGAGPALHCTALHCTAGGAEPALHCNALHCAALRCTALRCTALHCAALCCRCCSPVFWPPSSWPLFLSWPDMTFSSLSQSSPTSSLPSVPSVCLINAAFVVFNPVRRAAGHP